MDLKELRKEIDNIDSQLVQLFCRRMEISKLVGRYKKENSLPVYDKDREEAKIAEIKAACPEEFSKPAEALYREIFTLSREVQKKKCGLLGRTLGHSYSPQIHARLADYEYLLCEKEPEELEDFIKNGRWDGLNVTIPYKKAVLPFCQELSDRARRIGSVNTLVKRPDGSIYGENTDAFGFELLVKKLGVPVKGKRAIILGSGGAALAVKAVLIDLGVSDLAVISRSGPDNYDNLSRHYDAEIIVNTTPLGTYPNNGSAAVDLTPFKSCGAVFDLVYNPKRSALILQAENLNIPCASGLYMLVAQAKRSSELFSGSEIPDSRIDEISAELSSEMENIVLIGMPGCGKSTVASELSRISGRKLYDCDSIIEERIGMSIPEYFALKGENAFRELETQVLEELGKLSGAIISSGGGAVTRAENYKLMHQNSRIVWIKRALELLPISGRPISQSSSPQELYEKRRPLYESFSDLEVQNDSTASDCAQRILEALK